AQPGADTEECAHSLPGEPGPDSDEDEHSLPGPTSDKPEQDDAMPVLSRESDASPSPDQPHSSRTPHLNTLLKETALISHIAHSTGSTAVPSGTDLADPTVFPYLAQKRKTEDDLSHQAKVLKLMKLVETQRARKSAEKMIKKEPLSPVGTTPTLSVGESNMRNVIPNNNLTNSVYIPVFPKAKVLKLLGPASSKLRAQYAAQQAAQNKPEQKLLTPLSTIKDFNSANKSVESSSNLAFNSPIRKMAVGKTDVNANKNISPVTMKSPEMSRQSASHIIQLPNAPTKVSPSVPGKSKVSPSVPGKSLVLTITTCYICRQEFASYVLLKEHMKEHSDQDKQAAEGNDAPEAKIACGLCGVECLKKDMGEHFKTHGISDGGTQNADHSVNAAEETDMEHSMNIASRSYIEDTMDEDSNDMNEVEEGGNSAGIINCGICKTQCSQEQLFEHMERHNQKADRLNIEEMYVEATSEEDMKDQHGHCVFKKVYKCLKCAYVSDRPSRMKEHCRTCYFSDPLYGCKYCGKAYRVKRNLIRHLKSDHVENDDWTMNPNAGSSSKRHVCEKCFYETSKPSRYREHLQICGVTNDKFECILCEKVFKIKRYLNKHIKTHMTGKKFYCKLKYCRFKTEAIEEMKKHKDDHQSSETVDILKPEFRLSLEGKIKNESVDVDESVDAGESDNTTEYKESPDDPDDESQDTAADNEDNEASENYEEMEEETEGEN
ncbi:hypothetical protein DPMN_150616, partial [Dreissena polymorpha]